MIERSAMIEIPQTVSPRREPPRDAQPRAAGFERMLETASTRDPAAPREGNALEVLFDDRDGVGQSILLPWRLFANDALSQILKAHALDGAASDVIGGLGALSTQTKTAAAMGAATPPAPRGTMAAMVNVDAQAMVPPAMANAPSGGSERGAAASAPAVAPYLAQPWQTRLLRWLEHADGGLVARLRDYRLDDATQARCVEQLMNFARENGLNLQRVIVNAREVWRAPR